jgi:hypothetical protein
MLLGKLSAHDQQFVWLDLALTGINARGAAVLLQAIRGCEPLEEGLYLDLQVIGGWRLALRGSIGPLPTHPRARL